MATPLPPTPKGAVSRERLLDAAILLMRHSGLSGAGINEIAKTSGAPKGSIYHYFPDGKRQIAGEALAVYAQRLLGVIAQALEGGATPGDKVRALFGVFAQRLEDGRYQQSCAAGTVCLDLDQELDALRQVIAATFDAWVERIADALDLADPQRARSLAGLVLTAIEGAGIRGRAERSSRPFIEAGQWLGDLADREAASARAPVSASRPPRRRR